MALTEGHKLNRKRIFNFEKKKKEKQLTVALEAVIHRMNLGKCAQLGSWTISVSLES